jgi:hypothetical protein
MACLEGFQAVKDVQVHAQTKDNYVARMERLVYSPGWVCGGITPILFLDKSHAFFSSIPLGSSNWIQLDVSACWW